MKKLIQHSGEDDGNPEFAIYHYALQKLHIRPGEFDEMSLQERNFIFASILARVEAEQKAEEKAKNK